MTTDLIEISEDVFDATYPLRTNHLNPHACWNCSEGTGCLFETYGEELDFVRQQDPRTIWTIVDGEDSDLYVLSGYHFVNRIGYLLSTVLVPDGCDVQVRISMDRDEFPRGVIFADNLHGSFGAILHPASTAITRNGEPPPS